VPIFPSAQWIDAFCDGLAAHPRAPHVAAHLGGVYHFVVDPAGPLPDQHVYAVSLAVRDGAVDVTRVDFQSPSRVGVRTNYERWQQLLRGQLDLGRAMLFGQVRISGDLGALINARSDVDVLVDALRAVDTTWLEELA
jgi:hypothetical protein